jgi:hypothetical protein
MSRSIRHAGKRLSDIERNPNVPPVDWLDAHDAQEPDRLRNRFVTGHLRQAVGLAFRPPKDSLEVLAIALEYSPIVLWPHTMPDMPHDRRSCLAQAWKTLPDAFPDLYRRLRGGDESDYTAHLRAIWDDSRWLQFCRRFQYESVRDSEEQTT